MLQPTCDVTIIWRTFGRCRSLADQRIAPETGRPRATRQGALRPCRVHHGAEFEARKRHRERAPCCHQWQWQWRPQLALVLPAWRFVRTAPVHHVLKCVRYGRTALDPGVQLPPCLHAHWPGHGARSLSPRTVGPALRLIVPQRSYYDTAHRFFLRSQVPCGPPHISVDSTPARCTAGCAALRRVASRATETRKATREPCC